MQVTVCFRECKWLWVL